MTALTIQLPDLLCQQAEQVAKAQHISVEELVAESVAQRLSRLVPDAYLEERARRSDGKGMTEALAQVPDVPPEAYDKL